MPDNLEVKFFRDIPLDNPFFDSLKQDYKEFPEWFQRKALENAYVQYTDGEITGFLYLKLEEGEIKDTTPVMAPCRRLKIGTFKVEAHGTKLGERLLKKAFDFAIIKQAQEIYLTIFPKHELLIGLLSEFGFRKTGEKRTANGLETVFLKNFDRNWITGNLRKDYPLIDLHNSKPYLLAIKPEWHTQLFPDSILHSENYDLLADISHTKNIYLLNERRIYLMPRVFSGNIQDKRPARPIGISICGNFDLCG